MKHHAAALACILLLTAAFSAQSESAPASAKITQRQAAARPIGEFTDPMGFRRKYYVVPAGLSDAQLIELGRQLHQADKNAWLLLIDSDEQAKQFMATVAKTSTGDFTGYPGKWLEEHTVARSGLASMPKGGRQWLLFKGPYSLEQLTTLPCLDNKHKPGSRHYCTP